MDFAFEIARQGLGFLLFVGTLVVLLPYIRSLHKRIDDLQEKRILDVQTVITNFISIAKDLLNGNITQQKALENILNILQNMRLK